jgi:hypothetical protein
MVNGEAWLEEKYSVKQTVAELVTTVLWNKETVEATAGTALHHIRVWKDCDCVRAEIRKVR